MAPSGMTSTALGSIDLGPDVPGFELDLRVLVIPPGAANGMHSHARRPGFGYVLKGTLTGQRAGDVVTECGPGTVIVESQDVTHSVVNRGTSTVELLATHVSKKR
ncbi:MAG TPA: cupin domain-containing protein [Rhodanobacteraceae bacterium]